MNKRIIRKQDRVDHKLDLKESFKGKPSENHTEWAEKDNVIEVKSEREMMTIKKD